MMLSFLAALCMGCTSMKEPLKTEQKVQLPRYMGDWYVIANIPYFAEKNCFDSVESYALRADGKIDNWFTCRKKSFDAPLKRVSTAVATVDDAGSNASWTVKFFKVLSVKYLILNLDPDYQWVVVGHPSRRYGWIMARSKSLDGPTYQRIVRSLPEQGYDPAKFQLVPQRSPAAQPALKH
jgi:apolipoprotein D and lipocalin family protein